MFGIGASSAAAAADGRSRSPHVAVGNGSSRKRAAAGQKSQPKEEGGEAKNTESMEELMGMVGKMALIANQRSATAMGCLTQLVLLSDDVSHSEAKLGTAVKEAMRGYAEASRKMTPQQKSAQGPPHLVAWEVLTMWCLQYAKEKDEHAVVRKIEQMAKDVEALEGSTKMMVLGMAVKYCKLSKTYHRNVIRLEVMVCDVPELRSGREAWVEMLRMLITKAKGDFRQGKAPPSGLERKMIQKMKDMGYLEDREEEGR
eukprot:TRINITY_DN10643_c1_g2_i3.p2 TRINITY_DN10643_c1_g2~~TRINITY_DN10643_c1_g2_i3.p2  ORF type:complete len:257 (+),score=96.43 TRINITY_DN10643_c1_g2_i3:146-916(+)